MSHCTGNRSGYTVEYQNPDGVWKTLPIEPIDGVPGIAIAHHEHDSWINAMARVLSYEAAVAVIAATKAASWKESHCVKYRIRRWDVVYDIKATITDDTAEFIDNLFTAK
jgi:hypothetical protein